MTIRILALVAALLWLISPALTQTARVVATCNSAGYAAGPVQPLVQDINGNLCIAIVGLEQPDVTGTFTNATQTASVTSTSQDGFGTAVVTITGTYGTASGVFELSDDNGTTWFPMAIARSDGSGSETSYANLTNVSRAWIIPVAGMDLIRIRSTAVASGTVNVRISSTSVQTSPIPVVVTQITGNAAGTTGAVVGTLAAAALKTTFICGFNVQAIGGTAAVGPITIAGLVGSSQVYQGSSSAAGGQVAREAFSPCLPASSSNVAITITTTADGTATAVNVNSWGYQQ
jgi:hypothetical protein